jgi:hypothetical protein
MRTLRTLAVMTLIALASTSARTQEIPREWQLVFSCLAKEGFVNEVHFRLRDTFEHVSGDYESLRKAFRACREKVLKEVAALDTSKK